MAESDDPTAPNMRKERETKDDGRYIIFYTFGGAPEEGAKETPNTPRDEEKRA